MSGSLPAADVVFKETDTTGIMIMNRPKSRNAISICMTHALSRQLQDFEKHKKIVIVKSNVPKIFCAGGDVAEVLAHLESGERAALLNPRYGYQLVNLIATARVPYVALVDGITMGGGVGVSCYPAKYSVCTENVEFAMPELRIGLVCDVGSTYYLPRLRNHVGFYLALTGTRLRGYENVAVGTATHFCESARLPELEKALTSTDDVDGALNAICTRPEGAAHSLEPHLQKIDRIFRLESAEEILAELDKDGSAWAKKTTAIMRCMCPLAMKALMHAMHLGKNLSLDDCLQNEWILATTFFFGENVREGKLMARRYLVSQLTV